MIEWKKVTMEEAFNHAEGKGPARPYRGSPPDSYADFDGVLLTDESVVVTEFRGGGSYSDGTTDERPIEADWYIGTPKKG